MNTPLVLLPYTVDNGIATLTLNRPEKRNALNAATVSALKEYLARAAADENARVVVITGRGQDFCSGADLAELAELADKSAEENLADAMSLGELFIQMREHRLPIVAVVKGRALAGGCGLATACDIVLARDDAEFGYPEVHLGFVPAMVMAILRRKIPESKAFELMVSGDRISAVRAAELGIATKVFPAFTFSENVKVYLRELVKKSPTAVRLIKSLLYETGALGFEEGIRRGAEVNVEARMSEECREGVRRFLDKSARQAADGLAAGGRKEGGAHPSPGRDGLAGSVAPKSRDGLLSGASSAPKAPLPDGLASAVDPERGDDEDEG